MIKSVRSYIIFLLLLFAIFLFFQLSNAPSDFPDEGWKVLGLAVVMVLLWVSETVPFAITALLPLIFLSAMGVGEIGDLARYYAHPVIFLFLGGFLIALSLEKTELHKRIALYIIKYFGKSILGVLFGFMAATALLSMWISNTATTVMMVAIAIPVVRIILPEDTDDFIRKRVGTYLLLGIAFSANIGGISTIIGTPPNAVLFALADAQHGITIGFMEWLLYAFPIALFMMSALFIYFYVSLKSIRKAFQLHNFSDSVDHLIAQLKPLNRDQYIVLFAFGSSVFLWMFREPINALLGFKLLNDTMIALVGGTLPFFLPSSIKTLKFAVGWQHTRDLPWNILLLFGGGLSLAYALEVTGIIHWSADMIVGIAGQRSLLLLLLLPMLMLFLTEFMGNIAVITVFLPLTFQVGEMLDLSPTFFAYPVTIASSFAFMLPIATPPNAIIYSQGFLTIKDMIRCGVWMNFIGVVIIFIFNYLYFIF